MFRFIKISLLTASGVLTIIGFLMGFLGAIVLYLNKNTRNLFNMLEYLCKVKNDEFGGKDLTTVFIHVGIQAYFSLPLGICISFAGILSIMGAGNLSIKLLRVALAFWILSIICLLIFLLYTAIIDIDVDEGYMYCWLSVLTDRLQKGVHNEDKVLALMEKAEIFLECCGVRGPLDYDFYSEMFGSDRYPKSCCYVKKRKSFNCNLEYVREKVGCFYGVRNGILNRKRMFTFVIICSTLFISPVIMELHWMIRGIIRHDHVHEDDYEKSSDDSEVTESAEETNKV